MTDLLNDNVIPLLEAIGWSDMFFSSDGEMMGFPPDETLAEPVPLALIENFTEPDWRDARRQSPRLYCLVEMPNGEVVQARFIMGSFEDSDGARVTAVRWLPWRID